MSLNFPKRGHLLYFSGFLLIFMLILFIFWLHLDFGHFSSYLGYPVWEMYYNTIRLYWKSLCKGPTYPCSFKKIQPFENFSIIRRYWLYKPPAIYTIDCHRLLLSTREKGQTIIDVEVTHRATGTAYADQNRPLQMYLRDFTSVIIQTLHIQGWLNWYYMNHNSISDSLIHHNQSDERSYLSARRSRSKLITCILLLLMEYRHVDICRPGPSSFIWSVVHIGQCTFQVTATFSFTAKQKMATVPQTHCWLKTKTFGNLSF